jgi:hypothetical protein
MAYIRYSGSRAGVEVHVAKSWEVAMSRPMIVTYPTDAVLERHTVPCFNRLAEELLIPSCVTVCAVSEM